MTTKWENYLRQKLSGRVSRRLEDEIISIVKRLLDRQKKYLENKLKKELSRQGKLL